MNTAERRSAVHPGSEEFRMVRAIANSVVMEAFAHGESHLSFRGFRIDAARLAVGRNNDEVIRMELVVRLDGHMIDREVAGILAPHFI